MEQSKSLRRKNKVRVSKIRKKSKRDIREYINKKLDELSWNMGERNIGSREEFYDR